MIDRHVGYTREKTCPAYFIGFTMQIGLYDLLQARFNIL